MTQRTHWPDCWQSGPEHYECARAEVERLREAEAELHEIAGALPGVAYMDPPDGGSPSIAEQVRRMRADLDRTAAENKRQRADAERYKGAWETAVESHNVLKAELDALRERNAEWERKASAWMASPEAAQQLEGYRELAQRLNAAEAEVERLTACLSQMADVAKQYFAKSDLQRACVDALRADAERLDWLVQEIRLTDLMHLLREWNGDFTTIRAAIDAARGES